MRWYYRTAKIDPDLRKTFEQHGLGTMQNLLAAHDRTFVHKGRGTNADGVRSDLLPWLTEQYQRAETWETWSLTMEVAITVFVLVEVIIAFRR